MIADEVLSRYRRLREISTRQQSAALNRSAPTALRDQAKALGILDGSGTIVGSDEEVMLVFDLVVHAGRPGRSRTIDRYAASFFLADQDERRVLRALQDARFSVWCIERLHDDGGVIVTDVLREEETWLMDEGLTLCAQPGLAFASRLCWPDEFAMTCGVLVPVNAEAMEEAIMDIGRTTSLSNPARSAADPRFAVAVYRTSIESGLYETISYRDVQQAA